MAHAQAVAQSTRGETLADILERVLNVGVVIVGDIKIKLCDVELLSIQIRLLICSVEKAQELGIPWWWQKEAAHSDQAVSRTDAPHKPLPASQPPTHTPWEEYKRFHEFQKFQEAERAFEEGPSAANHNMRQGTRPG